MRPWRLVPAAEREMMAAADHYELVAPGLGDAFLEEIGRAIDTARSSPLIGRPLAGGRRQFPIRRFPYNLIYVIEGRALVVLAIAHHRRRPGYWM